MWLNPVGKSNKYLHIQNWEKPRSKKCRVKPQPVISLTTSTSSLASALIWSGDISVAMEFDLEAFLMNWTEFFLVAPTCFSTTEAIEGPTTGPLILTQPIEFVASMLSGSKRVRMINKHFLLDICVYVSDIWQSNENLITEETSNIFQNAIATSNKIEPKQRHHFLA